MESIGYRRGCSAIASLAALSALSAYCATGTGADGGTGPTTSALVGAYAAARRIPAGDVAGVVPGSMRVEKDPGTDTSWAMADFRPSNRAGAVAVAGFQDGGRIGIFARRGTSRWRLTGVGGTPAGCAGGLPATVRAAWNLPRVAGCGVIGGHDMAVRTMLSPVRSSGVRGVLRQLGGNAAGLRGRASIAKLAVRQVGVGDTPASTDFGSNCDPYTTFDGVGASSAGCGVDPGSGVLTENEEWCSDFAKWVWRQGGVTSGLAALTPMAASFYAWARERGQSPAFDAGRPRVGDAVLFYPSFVSIPDATNADHVGIVAGVNVNGTLNLVNGDFLGATNITVQLNTDVSLASWGAAIWGSGEKWLLVAPVFG